MTTANVQFDANTNGRFPCYRQYQGQINPQPAFISLDIRDGSIDADYSGEIGNAVPTPVWHGLVIRFPINLMAMAAKIAGLINDNLSEFQKIIDDSESQWDGSNWVGRYGENATQLIEALETEIYENSFNNDCIIDLEEWLEHNPYPDSGQDIDAFIAELLSLDGDNDCYFPDSLLSQAALKDAVLDLWADYLYSGKKIPSIVAQALLDDGRCEDSQWMDELKDYANA